MGDILSLKMYEVSNNIIFDKFIINMYLFDWGKINVDDCTTFIIKFINKLFNNPEIKFIYEKNFILDRYYDNINTFYLYNHYNFQITNTTDSIETENILEGSRKYIIFHCKARFDYCSSNFNNEINIIDFHGP